MLESNRAQLRRALVKTSDRKMLDRAWKAAGLLPADGKLSDAQMERMLQEVEADEIHICDTNGVIVRSSVPEYIGLDFRKHRQTLPFCELLRGKREYAQEFGPIAYDAHRYRKYVGVALKRGGLLQLGFNEDRYLPEPDLKQVRIVPVVVIAGIVVVLFLTVILCVYAFFRKRIIAPISRANASLARIASGELNEKVLAGGSTEMDALADDINTTVDRLRGYIAEAEHRAAAEMAMAKAIQYNVLPSTFPPYPALVDKIDIFARMITAKEVGGDFYDFYFAGKNRLALVIADVSGKGVPAALLMAITIAAFRSAGKTDQPVEQIVSLINNTFCKSNNDLMFVTLVVGKIDTVTGRMAVCNAGHNPIMTVRPDGTAEFLKTKTNVACGVMPDFPYEGDAFDLPEGVRIVIYSDGITEAENSDKDQYGETRLAEWAGAFGYGRKKEEDVVDSLLSSVRGFTAGAEQNDDMTIMSISF